MRTTKNPFCKPQISVNLHIPAFVNLELYDDSYSVIIALPITPEGAKRVGKYIDHTHCQVIEPNLYRGRRFWMVRMVKVYKYNISFQDACNLQAMRDLAKLKMWCREAKIDVLENEIEDLKLFY